MSHFTVLVITSHTDPSTLLDTIGDLEEGVAKQLAPYDENLQVPKYSKPCSCKHYAAQGKAIHECDVKFGPIETSRTLLSAFKLSATPNIIKEAEEKLRAEVKKSPDDKYWEKLNAYRESNPKFAKAEEQLEQKVQREWDRIIKPRQTFIETKTVEYDAAGSFDKNCENCKGKGTYKSQYNEQSKWDWYVVGGRWDKAIPDNICKIKNLPVDEDKKTFRPYAFVLPDGAWIEKAQMGWFGMSSGEMKGSKWNKIVKDIYKNYAENVVVLVDAHI
jgi:hypothetical protein